MQKKKTFSTMEIMLLVVVIGSLFLSFLQTWLEERKNEAWNRLYDTDPTYAAASGRLPMITSA